MTESPLTGELHEYRRYTGFTQKEKERIERLITTISLNYLGIKEIQKIRGKEAHRKSGDWGNTIQLSERHLGFTDAQLRAVLVHEIAHDVSPFSKFTVGESTGRNLVKAIAEQSMKTGIFLNRYHEQNAVEHKIAKDKNKQEALDQFYEETWAILVQLRYTNSDHLRKVQEAQRAAAAQKGLAFQEIISAGDEPAGIDAELQQTHFLDAKTAQEIDRRIGAKNDVHPDIDNKNLDRYRRWPQNT